MSQTPAGSCPRRPSARRLLLGDDSPVMVIVGELGIVVAALPTT
ncbi:hypothetical protein ACFWDI_08180 [Streptomyces sp. NPDC060064]